MGGRRAILRAGILLYTLAGHFVNSKLAQRSQDLDPANSSFLLLAITLRVWYIIIRKRGNDYVWI